MVWPLVLSGGLTALAQILPKSSGSGVRQEPVASRGGGGNGNLIFTLGLGEGVH